MQGGRKRCTLGKNCGGTCINRGKECQLELGATLSAALGKVIAHVQGKKTPESGVAKNPKAAPTQKEKKNPPKPKSETDKPKTSKSRREVSLDREEHAKALKSMGVSSGRAKDMAKAAHPSEENGSLTSIAKDMGVGTKTAKAIAKSERDKLQPQKGQITKLESVLGLGTLTRKDVGRDRSALIEEAKNLKANKMSEYDKLEKLENKLKREQAKPEQIRVVGDKAGKLWGEILEIDKAIKGPASATGNTRWAREDAKDFDSDLTKNKLTREGDKKFSGWDDSYGSGAKKLGEGSYGSVVKNKDGTVIKRGDVSTDEAKIMKQLEGKDLVPKLVAADINGPGLNSHRAVDIRRGRIAMGLIPGEPVGDRKPEEKVGGVPVADAYWKARAELHRNGVAHNDMHIENVLVDDKGKGRFVDMGLAQSSPKAALAEALGVFHGENVGKPGMPPVGSSGRGDWQVVRYEGTGGRLLENADTERGKGRAAAIKELREKAPLASKVFDNKSKAVDELKRIGLTNDEIASIMDHGIRNSMTTYSEGPWAKLSNEQAQSVINTLYEGV